MGLLYGLIGLRELDPERFGYLHIAHLNHQLRGADSDADAAFVVEQARRLDLPVTVGAVEVKSIAKATGESTETTARNQRYQFLTKTAQEWKCQAVAVGHNADDNAETILHRIIRGTGIRGLRGIPAIRPMTNQKEDDDLFLVRPLLSLQRAEIEAFLQQRGIPWRRDASNESTDYTRNRIRHELIPFLKEQFNPQVAEALLRLGRTAQTSREINREKSDKQHAYYILERSDNRLILNATRLAQEHQDQQIEIIFQTLTALAIPLRRIGYQHIKEIFKLINHASGDGGKCSQYPDGLEVRRDQGKMIFLRSAPPGRPANENTREAIFLPARGEIDLPDDIFRIDPKTLMALPVQKITVEQISPGKGYLPEFLKNKTSFSEVFDWDRIVGPLTLRVWEPGDRFAPLGMTGAKTLGDFFTDMKVPAFWRSRVGLVCDDQGILWVLGLRISERIKIRQKTTRILKIVLV